MTITTTPPSPSIPYHHQNHHYNTTNANTFTKAIQKFLKLPPYKGCHHHHRHHHHHHCFHYSAPTTITTATLPNAVPTTATTLVFQPMHNYALVTSG
jgi:hypothetical protein